ncbi:hypothetical protein BJF82_05220 [Kytococcus sp. CUA-901]|nr:hypothetical protein BJF82_05220 [Kytococcus sp. CUA-901]
MHGWRPWLLVGLGGAVGSVARVLLSEAWGTEAGVLAVNLVGAFLLGVADAVWRGRRPLTVASGERACWAGSPRSARGRC